MPKRSPADGGALMLATFLSGTAAACGTTSTAITVPSGATSAWIHARGAAIYYNAGGTVAATTDGGYVAADMHGYIPPSDNFNQMAVIGGGTASVAHIEFYQD